MLDPVEVPLEAQPVRIGLLGAQTSARSERTGRPGSEREIERVLTVFAPEHSPAHEGGGIGMGVPDDQLVHFLHASRVPGG